MHGYISRQLTTVIESRLVNNPAVALLGPRQAGKSTLASVICEKTPDSLYLDLEREKDRAMLSNLEDFFLSIVID